MKINNIIKRKNKKKKHERIETVYIVEFNRKILIYIDNNRKKLCILEESKIHSF